MHILITGTTGYIAKRLALRLLEEGHELTCCVRDLERIPDEIENHPDVKFIKVDFLNTEGVSFPSNLDAAYYLIHSMSSNNVDFNELEQICARNFKALIEQSSCEQVIYLSRW